ncbi:uncharacterized protein ACLA_087140 [Aspergillus clavatus NRRL 1]|uniref:Mediator of RNA polymerase II transcription subunit 4 n=1 Tax=Aspergillus clavatus (strain ATCC 1007 / CBS 513.65 / DSM 816 / NCTC 3887 / NRRL 1 / QM 1276 / 107) TaxID=344612 RepID=A1CUM4_ASPCL|nr:uncharacterized protein ACLA_087140 [Aspergillus clavatus NRRL 1]EAW07011.1 conserved hypothetical protein [Aspergillus clavatus NRRL 1]
MNVQFRHSLSTIEDRLNALITSLTTSPTASGAPAAALALLDANDSLTSAIDTLRQHQENYDRILRLRAEAESLEEKVKGVVREVVEYEKEIRAVCGDDDMSDSDVDDDGAYAIDDADRMETRPGGLRRTKEIDYKLLLDFARRISKYNHQAAADAAAYAVQEAQARGKRLPAGDQDVAMTGVNGGPVTEEGAEPVSSVTKEATSWLDESAKMTRQAYMVPYPMEDRIRMGVMGQIQLAAAEGRPGFDSDKEVERLIREAEGLGAAEPTAPAQAPVGEETRHANEAAKAAAHAGAASSGATAAPVPAPAPAPAPKPKTTLDLDLYDPEDDEM